MTTRQRLTAAQRRELHAELEAERGRLERSLAASSDPGGMFAGSSGPASETHGALGIAVESRAQARHDALIAALSRLTNGDYGTCEGCRAFIPYERLIVMPEVAYCVACSA
jgi:DnaK suppressor protein